MPLRSSVSIPSSPGNDGAGWTRLMHCHSDTFRHSCPTRLKVFTGLSGRIMAAVAGDPLKLDKLGTASDGNWYGNLWVLDSLRVNRDGNEAGRKNSGGGTSPVRDSWDRLGKETKVKRRDPSASRGFGSEVWAGVR